MLLKTELDRVLTANKNNERAILDGEYMYLGSRHIFTNKEASGDVLYYIAYLRRQGYNNSCADYYFIAMDKKTKQLKLLYVIANNMMGPKTMDGTDNEYQYKLRYKNGFREKEAKKFQGFRSKMA